jgi:hypothetical protein
MYNYGNLLSIAIGLIISFIVLFLILREFWCWYWKINERVALLEEQTQTLKTINDNLLKNLETSNKIYSLLRNNENKTDNHIINKLI